MAARHVKPRNGRRGGDSSSHMHPKSPVTPCNAPSSVVRPNRGGVPRACCPYSSRTWMGIKPCPEAIHMYGERPRQDAPGHAVQKHGQVQQQSRNPCQSLACSLMRSLLQQMTLHVVRLASTCAPDGPPFALPSSPGDWTINCFSNITLLRKLSDTVESFASRKLPCRIWRRRRWIAGCPGTRI